MASTSGDDMKVLIGDDWLKDADATEVDIWWVLVG